MPTLDTTIYIYTSETDHEIPVRIDYDAIYQPARISGPPENCYPDESEMTINAIEPLGDLPEGITQKILEEVAADMGIEDECWEHYHSRGVDDGE